MSRTLNALEQSPSHDPTCGSARAGNNMDYREIILGSGMSTAFHPGYTRDKTGTHISIDKGPLTPRLGNVYYREIILGNGTCRLSEDATAPKPGP